LTPFHEQGYGGLHAVPGAAKSVAGSRVLALLLALAALGIWLYLIFLRGAFWRCAEREEWEASEPAEWPRVAVVVPARNEADHIAASLGSLLNQNYPGSFMIVLVDDVSTDGTGEIARGMSATHSDVRLHVVTGQALPPGWTGKLWALKQGIAWSFAQQADYLLLTDADIVHPPDSVARLVAFSQQHDLVLTSLMVKLRCRSFAERANIPAFVFFFQMLYPFAWVNRRDRATAAAAGGCMLVRADALTKAGGIESIRDALIDDCALARVLKRHGPIWLALTQRVHSLRAYPRLADIHRMVTRSAYAQLRYSPALLLATTTGMIVTYMAPPLLAIFSAGAARLVALLTWGLMALAFVPTLRFYRLSPSWALALPAIALEYLLFTLDSAYQHMRGRGGAWKGRVQGKRL
jgi:hopene-associated glycosyltransferase HpnB